MANVKFQAPNPYSQQAADLNRRQKMAEMLQQQSMEPLQQQSAGGMVIPLNPLAGLAKVLQSYTSSRQLSDLDKKRAGLEAQDIKSAQEMMAQFRNSATEQPIAEGDNTLQELAVRPMAQSSGVKPVIRSQLMKAGLAPGSEDYEAASAPARLNELVSPAVSLAERRQNLLPAAMGANAGPYQQKLAEMLYNEQPAAPKGAFAPINMKDVDASKSNVAKYRETGDPQYLTMLIPEAKPDMTAYQAARLAQIDAAAKAPRPAVNLQKGPAYKLVGGEIRESVFNPQTGQSFFSNAEGGLVKIPENATLVRADPEKLRNLPATIATALLTNTASLNQLDRALKLNAGETITLPDGEVIVGDKDAVGVKGFTPQDVLNRTDPKGISTRAEIANIGSMIIHDRSGAAVTASEAPRLKPFIPLITDNNETVKKKLTLLRAAIRDEDSSLRSIYSEDQGYRPVNGSNLGNQEPSSGFGKAVRVD